MKTQWLFRQGDILFKKIDALPCGERTKREGGIVAYGEVTGHTHRLAVADREHAEVYEIEGGLFVHVRDGGIAISGATFVHEEHAPIELPAGTYGVTIQREYSPDAIRNVLD